MHDTSSTLTSNTFSFSVCVCVCWGGGGRVGGVGKTRGENYSNHAVIRLPLVWTLSPLVITLSRDRIQTRVDVLSLSWKHTRHTLPSAVQVSSSLLLNSFKIPRLSSTTRNCTEGTRSWSAPAIAVFPSGDSMLPATMDHVIHLMRPDVRGGAGYQF